MRTFFGCLLVAIIVLGCGLRFLYHASSRGQSDEAITVEVLRHLRQSGDWDVNWKHANLSPDLRYDQYNFSSHLYATYFFYRFIKILPGTLRWRSEGEGFAVYRFFVAALASVAVYQVLQLTRKLDGRMAAIVAGLLTAVATLLVQDGHFVRPEAFTTVLTLAAIGLSLRKASARGWGPILAAFCIGILVACKVSMLLLIWLPFVPMIARWQHRSKCGWTMAAVVIAMAGGFVAGAPGALTNPAAYRHGIGRLMGQYAGLHPPHSHLDGSPVADMMFRYFVATLGWPVIAFFALGVVVLARQRAYDKLAVVVGPVVLFFGYFATRSVFFERNVSHVLPLVFVAAGIGVAATIRALMPRSRRMTVIAAGAICAALVFGPATLAFRLVAGELSGRASREQHQFEEALRARYPGLPWTAEGLMTDAPLHSLAAHFRNGGGELLLRVSDHRDEWTALNVGQLRRRFQTLPLAEHPGAFPGLPTCTLLTYHTEPAAYFLIRGLAAQQASR